MAITTRYTLLGSGANFMDFYSPYGALVLDGETIAFKGGSGVDQVYVGSAVGLNFDFTQSGTGVDKVYLSGNWADYSRVATGTTLTLTRISGGSEIIKVNTGDNLIFADGYVTVADAISNARGTLPGLTLNAGETTAAYPVTVAGPFNNTVRAVVQDPSGETIATTRPGVALIVKGGSGVDIVYVNAGTQVDASQLGGGTDKVYLMGNFDDYTGTVAGTNVTLTRTVGSDVEIVKILKGSVSANDTIVFADGTTTSFATFNYWSAPTTTPHPVLSSSELTPLPGPTVSITSSLNALHIGSSATITFTLSESSSDFTVADVTVSGATLSNFSGAGTTYTATLTPLAQSTTTATISVAGHTFIGSSGKSNTTSPTLSVPIDTVIDTPVVSLLNDTGVVNTDHITSSAALSLSTPAADVTRTFTVDGGQAELIYVAPTTTGNHTVVVTDTDTAGNSANATLTFTLDVGAPTISEQAAHSATQTIELVYTENLDVLHLPSANAFTVTTGGAANAVTAVSVTGSVVTLTLANAFAPGVVTVAYNDPTAGNDANALQDLAGNDASSFISGVLADGYVRGANVYIDTNGSGTVDAGDFYVGVTDAFGNFFIPSNAPTTGAIMAIGGFNTDTGVANTLPLKAPAGSTTINPLTTLVQAVIDASQGVTTAAEASATVATNLGLTIPQGQSLTSYDPIASGDLAAQKVAAQIATIVSLATTESSGSGGAVMSNIANEIQNAAPSTVVNLSDTTVLTNALNGVTTSVGLQSAIADASSAIGSATTLSAVSAVQSQYLDNVAPDAPTLAIAANTNDATPQLTVTVNITDQAGHAAVAGDTIVVRDGAVQIASIVLDAAAAKAGQVVVSLPTLSEGLHNLTAVAVDQAGNASASSTNASVKVDTIAPNAPVINAIAGNDIVGLAEQASTITGTAEANTNLTLVLGSASHNVVVQANGSWSYTLDAADLTALGQGSANVSATASDAAGNVGATGSRAILVDTVAPIATASITGTTSPVVNNVTTDNTPGLQGAIVGQLAGNESVAIFVDGVRVGTAQVSGATWSFTTGSLSSSNVLHSFAAQVEDSAANIGTMSADFSLTVNATVPSAAAAFDSGTGYSTSATPVLTGTIFGTLNGGDVVVISEGSTLLGQAVVTNGTWSFTPSVSLGEGAHTFTAVVESSGGNQGTATLSPVLTIDTVAPNLPTINAVTADNVINAAETGTQVTGTAEAGSTVTVTIDGNVSTETVATNGTWSHTLSAADLTAMGQNAALITVKASDAAGNQSAVASRSISVDTLNPNAPSLLAVAGDDKINSAEMVAGVVLSGTAEVNARVDITLGLNNVRSVMADGSGNWSYTLGVADVGSMGQGNLSISAVVTDAAGNTGASASRPVLVDTLAPVLSALTIASDSGVQGDSRSSVATPVVQFTSEVGAQLELSLDGGAFQAPVVATGGVQTLTSLASLTTQGAHSISVRETDAAGNTTVRSVGYSLDSVGPTLVGSTVNGSNVTLSFSEAVDASNYGAVGAFGVTVGGLSRGVTSMGVSGNTVTLLLATPVAAGEAVSLSYIDPTVGNDSSALQDAAGNDVASINAVALTNSTAAVPTVVSAAVVGNTVTVTYNEALDAAHQPDIANLGVVVNGNGRAVVGAAVNGNTLVMTLGLEVAPGDAVTFAYRDVTGDDVYAVQDLAGNDAASIASATPLTVTNNTQVLTGAPTVIAASFTEAANSSISFTFNHPMQVFGSSPTFTVRLLNADGTTSALGVTGSSISGGVVTLTTAATLTATDAVIVNYGYNGNSGIYDTSFQWPIFQVAVIGGSGANTINLSNTPDVWGARVFGNGGNDIVTGGNGTNLLAGGGGADILTSGWGVTGISLADGSTRVSDTLQINNGLSGLATPDSVYGFDTTNTTTSLNDILALPSAAIAANTVGFVNGTDASNGTATTIKSHSITNGVATFATADDGTGTVLINAANIKAAVQYLAINMGVGQTVAFNYDADGNGYADSQYVYQKSGNLNATEVDILLALRGVVGTTLGNSAGLHVVQIADGFAPRTMNANLSSDGMVIQINEALASVDFSGLTLQHGHTAGGTQTISGIASFTAAPDANNATKINIVTSDNTLGTAGDFVLVSHAANSLGVMTDTSAKTSTLFDATGGIAMFAIGGVGAQIDLSGQSASANIYAVSGGNTNLVGSAFGSQITSGTGNDTLTGGVGNDQLEGGSGNDVLIGGNGSNVLIGGAGADTLTGGTGVDKFTFYQGDSPALTYTLSASNTSGGVGNGDTFVFANGAGDVIVGGMNVTGANGDKVNLWSNSNVVNDPHPITVVNGQQLVVPTNGQTVDQQYFVVRGDYAGGTFTVNTTTGADSLVVYDGNVANTVTQTGVVIQGITPNALVQEWGQITLAAPDTTAPTVVSASVVGNIVTVIYNEALDAAHQADMGNIGITVGTQGRGINNVAVNGNTLTLTLGVEVVAGETVTFTYRDVGGDDAYAIQDLAGNDAATIASATPVTVTNNTTALTGQPSVSSASFTEAANSVVSVVFNHPMQIFGTPVVTLNQLNADGTTTALTVTNVSISNQTLLVTTTATLGSTNSVIVDFNSNGSWGVTDTAGQWPGSKIVVIGGTGASTIDLTNKDNLWDARVFANGGNDTVTAGNGTSLIVGSGGADTLISNWGSSTIRVNDGGTRVSDTVKINTGTSGPVAPDNVFGFDTTNASGNDILALPSGVIAANTGVVNGIDVANGTATTIKSHSISGGVATFATVDDGTGTILINSGNLRAAIGYLSTNMGVGQTVAFNYDADGSGNADTQYVYQKSGSQNVSSNDILVALRGVVGTTLGSAEGLHVVQIADGFGPMVNSSTLSSDSMVLQTNEVIASVDFSGFTLKHGHTSGGNQTLTDIATFTAAPDGTNATKINIVTSDSGLGTVGDFVLVTHGANLGVMTDATAKTSNLFDLDSPTTAAIGGVGAQINLSTLGVAANIIAVSGGDTVLVASALGSQISSGGGNDSLTGGAGNDRLEAGSGNDVLVGGNGSNVLNGGVGADTVTGGTGVDNFVFYQGDSTTLAYSDVNVGSGVSSGDTFVFAGGADVIAGGLNVTGTNGDKINFWTDSVTITSPHAMTVGNNGQQLLIPTDGLVQDQGYFVVQGNYLNGTFTVNTTTGADSLVVYDGSKTGSVTQTGLVIQGIAPSALGQDYWGQIYLV